MPHVGPRFCSVDLPINGRPIPERLRESRVDEQAILTAARELQGLERMDQVRHAVLERNGTISIIPVRDGKSVGADR
jgi:uncharacterized membrane protein YcaP (DUF421 family)